MNESMEAMILSVMTTIFCNCVEKPEKFGTSLRHIIASIYNDFHEGVFCNAQSILESQTFGSDLMRPNCEGGLFHTQSCFP